MEQGASFYRGHRGGGDEPGYIGRWTETLTEGDLLYWYRQLRNAPPFDRDLDHDHALVYDLQRDWWTCGLAGCDHRITGEAFANMNLPPAPVPAGVAGAGLW